MHATLLNPLRLGAHLLILLPCLLASGAGQADSSVVAWGYYWYQNNAPSPDFVPVTRPPVLTNAVAVAGGMGYSLALLADGTVSGWGDNRFSQRRIPADLTNAVAIAAGDFHALALRADGTVAAWGAVGDTNLINFGQASVPSGLTQVVAVAAGARHNLALRADGTVVVWGDNTYGQTVVPAGLSNVVAIASGSQSCLALQADGNVVVWGYFAYPAFVPAGLSNVVAIAAGGTQALAQRADGTVAIWGNGDDFGHLGPTPELTNVVELAAGWWHNLARRADGSLIAWGAGRTLQPATGIEFGQARVPASVTNAAAVAGAWCSSTVLAGDMAPFLTGPFIDRTVVYGSTAWFRAAANGSAPLRYQWRFNGTDVPGATHAVLALDEVAFDDAGVYSVEVSNAFGTATSPGMRLHVAPLFLPTQPLSQVGVPGETVTFGVLATGTGPFSYQWQFNGVHFEGATNSTLVLTNLQRSQAGIYSVIVRNAAGAVESLPATLSLTQVSAWGDGTYGQLRVPPGLTNLLSVSAGGYHSLALKTDGTVASWGCGSVWGWEDYGQLQVPDGLTNVVEVCAGHEYSIARKADGTVVAWGGGNRGQTHIPRNLRDVVAISARGSMCLALKTSGEVVAWGALYSQKTQSVFHPVTLPPDLGRVVAISAGGEHGLALRADGRVVAWGINDDGQTNVPADLRNVVAIAAGGRHNLALRADGTVVAWGIGYDWLYGELGQTNVPPGLNNVVAIAAGAYHSLALKADGTVVAWGAGEPGDPPPVTWTTSPPHYGQSAVPPDLPASGAVSAGYLHSLALVRDGPPILTGTPVNRSVGRGQSAFFRVAALGSPPFSFQWRCNGTNLPGATNAVLALDQVGFDQAGAYSVVVSNAHGAVVSSEEVMEVLPFSIMTQPRSQLVNPGSTVYLTVGTDAGWPFTCHWRFNGTDLPGVTSSTLVLPNIQIAQSGAYSVVVSNSEGSATSLEAQVCVTPVIAWGANDWGQLNLPFGLTNVVSVVAGSGQGLVLRSDGTVAAWGNKGWPELANGAARLTHIVSIAPYCLAATTDGAVVAWGNRDPARIPSAATNVVAVASRYQNLALRADGKVVVWDEDPAWPTQRPPATLSNVVAIASGDGHSLALKGNGTVVGWGDNNYGQTRAPAGLSNVVAIAAGSQHSVALKADGTVVTWGANYSGQTNVPPGLTNVLAIAAGGHHSLALTADRTLVLWGDNPNGSLTPPLRASNVVAMATSDAHVLALVDSPPLLARVSAPDSQSVLFRQTGLMSQTARVFNPSPLDFRAVRAVVQDLTAGATVYNASGTNAQGQPYVQYNLPLAPGAAVDLTIEYFVPNRSMPSASLIVEAVDPIPALDLSGTPQEILRSLRFAGGTYLIDFRTLANHTYYVQYSADLETWKTAFPPVTGTGSTMQWVDNGPPKTESHPGTQTNRFYRVLLVP